MTQTEIEADLQGLRAQVSLLQRQQEGRQKTWRMLAVVSSCSSVLFAVAGLSFLLVDTFWDFARSFPTAHAFITVMGYQLIIASLPCGLLAQALTADARTAG